MIINTEHVDTMLNSMTSSEISKMTGVPERTIQKYKSRELGWLGKNSIALAQLAEKINQMQYFVNVNDGRVIKATEYIDMVIREASEAWNELDDDEKEEDYHNTFALIYDSYIQSDSDFVMSDEYGNVLEDEDQYWNKHTTAYQSNQITKMNNL